MDTARYVFAVLVVTFLPPGLAWWFIVHPFIRFWRGVGATAALATVGVVGIGGVIGLMRIRQTLVGPDLGTHAAVVTASALLMVVTVWIAWARKKHLTTRIMVGIPELKSEGDPGALLDQGIYARIRHPRYVEIALGTLAYATFSNYLGAYITAALTLPVLHLIVVLEERELMERFGDAYREYAAKTPRYVPKRTA